MSLMIAFYVKRPHVQAAVRAALQEPITKLLERLVFPMTTTTAGQSDFNVMCVVGLFVDFLRTVKISLNWIQSRYLWKFNEISVAPSR
jgi:hypothetical protein